MGAKLTLTLDRHGLMPAGGGKIIVEVAEAHAAADRSARSRRGRRAARGRDRREVAESRRRARARGRARTAERSELRAALVRQRRTEQRVLRRSHARERRARAATSHGRKGYPAEDVADDALDELEDSLEAGVPVGEHCADRLLLPMAVAGGGRFRTLAPLSLHATTNIETIAAFLDVPIRVTEADGIADVSIG